MPNIAALSAVVDGPLREGTLYYVETVRSYWRLAKTSTLTVDTITIAPTASASGRWLRELNIGDASWLYVASWYIDAASGDDENNGQAQVPAAGNVGPLKTHAELERRWAKGAILPPLDAVQVTRRICRVFVLTDTPATDPFNVEIEISDADTFLLYTGELARSVVYSGTISAVTALNAATNQAWEVTDPGATWVALLNRRARITSAGTNLNGLFWVAKDMGANVARISNPGTPSPMLAAPNLSSIGFNARTPAVGNTYVVETLPTVTFGTMNVRAPNAHQNVVNVGELNVRTGWAANRSSGLTIALDCYGSSVVDPSLSLSYMMNNCYFSSGLVMETNGQSFVAGGLFSGSFALLGIGGLNTLVNAPLLQAIPLSGTNIRICSVQIFDCVVQATFNPGGHAINVGRVTTNNKIFGNAMSVTESPLGADVAAQSVFGSGNAGVGIFVGGGAKFIYPPGSTLAVTGTAGDFELNSGTQSRAFDMTTGLYTPLTNNTWALLGTAIGGGGFGGSAHNPQAEAHLVNAALS